MEEQQIIESIVKLEEVSLIDLFGPQDQNIKLIRAAFPNTKIIFRGNEAKIRGAEKEIITVLELLEMLIGHCRKYGKLDQEQLKSYLNTNGGHSLYSEKEEEAIVYGQHGVIVRPRTPNQRELVEAVAKNDLVFALGPAGTGKTFVSVALAVRAFKNKEVRKIIFTRPAVEAGESLGFLPGDMKEKIDPYLRPIYDALELMLPAAKLQAHLESGDIEIAPLAFMRGRTLDKAFVILDEAQNTTTQQMRMFLTRMGPSSKIIVNGDKSQVDLPSRVKSGLAEAIHILSGVKGIRVLELTAEDVVRHKLVREIILAYDKFDVKD